MQAPQQQHVGMVPVGAAAAGGYGTVDANALAAAPKRQRTRVAQESCGTSLLEFFSEQQIETHVAKLRSKDPALMQVKGVPKQQPGFDPFQAQEMESNCKVCELNRLTFEPPSLYCFGCGQRIKRNQVFYGTPFNHEIKGVWCHPCYQDIKTETVPLDGFNIRKAELEKRKNDDEVEEGWVQCDQCEGWVHQICGLFNKGRNDQNRGFLCPFCLRDGLRTGERRVPGERPQAMLTARDLPPCDLSEHLERRLERVLREERMQRAAMEGRHPSEVRTAEGLTVRVVNNVVKRNDVRQRLYNLVKPEGYPEAFMYKQKVILLFQNIDGVDLCLYCMYMQEYGDDVPPPNRKSVYLSYLDSVKYFQPEDVLAAGRSVALRTMVYHEMLLGYLEYAKARGFESMFIWACPPLAGDDYILYCHPGKQKTPRSDRLREWYLTMLNRAKEEGTVTYISNMWDTYFEGGRDHRLDRLSITQLPYYDGDYWPGEAENLLASISTEAQQGGASGKPAIKTTSSSRSKPLKGKRVGPASGSIADELLSRLGETIQGMREDFIVVHLQEPCSFCREYMSEGVRYYHPSPPQKVVVRSERTFDGISLDKPGSDATRTVTYTRFALCTKCYSAECAGHGKGLPPGMQIGELLPARNPRIPPTVDTVQEMDNEFFDTRTAFLSLCQGNHYQFDSLRRAKHSSMMVLYHLHNPTAPAFSCTCNICHKEIQSGEGWRCGTCPDFDMCNACFLNPAMPRHPHQLVRHARDIDERRSRLTQEQLSARNQSLHRTMQVLLHASNCTDQKCPSTSCARVKAMYHHALTCPVKIAGNCQYCRRMWMLLQMHATHCTVPNCQVPRCTQLRNIRRRQATRAEDKRRAAYRTMLRQQTGG